MGNFGVNSSKEKVILLPTRKLNIIFTVGCGTALRNIFFFSQKIKQEHSSHSPRGLQKKKNEKRRGVRIFKTICSVGDARLFVSSGSVRAFTGHDSNTPKKRKVRYVNYHAVW